MAAPAPAAAAAAAAVQPALVGAAHGPAVGVAGAGVAAQPAMTLEIFMSLTAEQRQLRRAQFGVYGDVEPCVDSCEREPPYVSPKGRSSRPAARAMCCGARIRVTDYGQHLRHKAKGKKDTVHRQILERGVTAGYETLQNKSCGGWWTRCIGCLNLHRDDEYLHECPVIGQKYQKKVIPRKPKPAAAAAVAAEALLAAAPAAPRFPRAQVLYSNFDGPACPEAAAAIEASPLATFSQEDLALVASMRTELAPHLVNAQDAGPGIAPDRLEQIFEAYFTTKEKGTGLGLAIVKHNVELYGGTVRVDSALGKGAKFTVCFPAKALLKPFTK